MRNVAVASAGLALGALAFAPIALAHGDDPSPSRLIRSWTIEPAPLLLGLLFLALFVHGFLRLRHKRRDRAQPWRLVAAVGVVTVALVAVSSPLDAVGEQYLISGHMLQHVLLADVAPALAALAISGPLAYFLFPKRLLLALARLDRLRRAVALIVRPGVSFAIWAVSLAVWHIPAVYDAALENSTLHDLEHLSFAIGGMLIWAQLLGLPGRRSSLRRLGYLVAVYAFGELLAYAFILSFHPYYPAYAAQDTRLFGIGVLLDQKLAGLVMMAEQTLTLGLCALWLVREHRRERRRLEVHARRRYLASREIGRA